MCHARDPSHSRVLACGANSKYRYKLIAAQFKDSRLCIQSERTTLRKGGLWLSIIYKDLGWRSRERAPISLVSLYWQRSPPPLGRQTNKSLSSGTYYSPDSPQPPCRWEVRRYRVPQTSGSKSASNIPYRHQELSAPSTPYGHDRLSSRRHKILSKKETLPPRAASGDDG